MSTDLGEIIEGELVSIDSTALEAINRSEIDIQITTAKRFPRSLVAFKRQATEFATLDEDTAASMFYKLPRGGKFIEGPSVRLAEVVGSCWGNVRYGARIVATDDKFVTAQGMCFDLEKNISAAVEVKRRITDKNGRRFNDDMIQVTSNAACSVALRQAIFKVVPYALVKGIYDQAKLTSVGKAESMAERRAKMMGWFTKLGVSDAQVLTAIERKGVEEITIDDLITLRGLATAIKDGETTIEEAFQVHQPSGKKVATSDLTDKLKKTPEAPKAPEPPADDASDWSEVMSMIEGKLAACTTIGDVKELQATSTDDPSLDDTQRQAIAEACQNRANAIRGARGAGSNKQGHLLGD